MSLSLLFSTIDRAKNLGSYKLANLAFACLLDKALDFKSNQLKFLWETECHTLEDWVDYNPSDMYYDIPVISDGLRSACIPAPLLKPGYAKAFMCMSEIVDRKIHQRKLNYLEIETAKETLLKLYADLIEAYPNAWDLAFKYLDGFQCQSCPYLCESGAIHCTVHPYGMPAVKCPDHPGFDASDAIARLEQEREYWS